jgi:hypothetical protein
LRAVKRTQHIFLDTRNLFRLGNGLIAFAH